MDIRWLCFQQMGSNSFISISWAQKASIPGHGSCRYGFLGLGLRVFCFDLVEMRVVANVHQNSHKPMMLASESICQPLHCLNSQTKTPRFCVVVKIKVPFWVS